MVYFMSVSVIINIKKVEEGRDFMTLLKEKAVDMIRRMPEDKLYYVVQLLESVEGLYENTVIETKTPERRALEDLQRFRKCSDVEIDYKAELAKAREEKYANID
ncbi:MAG: UDP-N-acetylenolpyruvoylglucosamine reductase [Lachnospiraceae bacterium]|nr:UDP-N-acetylenolpyruvoylglucosamine reductase [Lachnospiraceae bacterium]